MKRRAMKLAGLPGLFLSLAAISSYSCGQADDQEQIRKKSMPDLNYAYADFDSATLSIDEAIASIMELYALDPHVFGDPIGIIAEFSDSLSLLPAGRQIALILTDASWEPPAGINKETVSGGDALVCDCYPQYKSLDSCWREMADFARRHDLQIIPPGMEIYEGFETETVVDSSATQLIIRIR